MSSNLNIISLACVVSLALILQKILNFPVVICATVIFGISFNPFQKQIEFEMYFAKILQHMQ